MKEIDRRGFLVRTGGGAAAFAFSPVLKDMAPLAAAEEPLRTGVVGVGRRGRAILAELAKLPAAQVVAIADPDERRVKAGLRRAEGSQAFSSVENGVKSIPGTTFGIEGNEEMRAYLVSMASAIGGNPISLRSEDKPMYHLSGVMLGGLLSALAAVSAQLWEQFGMRRADGVKALAPMMRQVSINLETSGVPGAMAGPYIRGDIGTILKHLEALQLRAPEVLPLYCELALAGLPFALEKGALKPERGEEIRRLVEKYRRKAAVNAGASGPSAEV